MTLRTDFKDQTDAVYIPTLPEPHTIHAVNDWGYGVFSDHIPSSAYAVAATINGVTATIVTTAPLAGQVRVWYADTKKTSFWQCNVADNGKTLAITDYRGQGTTYNSEIINEQNTEINSIANWTKFKVNTYSNLPAPASAVVGVAYYVQTGTEKGNWVSDGSAWSQVGTGGTGVAPTVTVSPANGSTGIAIDANITATWNKWLDDDANIAGKLKVYPTATDRTNDTNAIAGTLTRTSNKVMTLNPTSNLGNNAQFYPRILSGLKFADGTSLSSPIDWDFVVGTVGNTAPTFSAQPTTKAGTQTSTALTIQYAVTDAEANPITHKVAVKTTSNIIAGDFKDAILANGLVLTDLGGGSYEVAVSKLSSGAALPTGTVLYVQVQASDGTTLTNSVVLQTYTLLSNPSWVVNWNGSQAPASNGWIMMQGTNTTYTIDTPVSGEMLCETPMEVDPSFWRKEAQTFNLIDGSTLEIELKCEADDSNGAVHGFDLVSFGSGYPRAMVGLLPTGQAYCYGTGFTASATASVGSTTVYRKMRATFKGSTVKIYMDANPTPVITSSLVTDFIEGSCVIDFGCFGLMTAGIAPQRGWIKSFKFTGTIAQDT